MNSNLLRISQLAGLWLGGMCCVSGATYKIEGLSGAAKHWDGRDVYWFPDDTFYTPIAYGNDLNAGGEFLITGDASETGRFVDIYFELNLRVSSEVYGDNFAWDDMSTAPFAVMGYDFSGEGGRVTGEIAGTNETSLLVHVMAVVGQTYTYQLKANSGHVWYGDPLNLRVVDTSSPASIYYGAEARLAISSYTVTPVPDGGKATGIAVGVWALMALARFWARSPAALG